MLRYLRLYLSFLRFSFAKSSQFRLDFFFRIFMDIIYYVVNISFFKAIFLHTPTLGGWTEGEMLVFVGAFITVDALMMTFVSNNIWVLPQAITKGELDYYLLRPVSALFFLSSRDIAVNSFLNLLMATGILGWALWSYPLSFSLFDLAVFAVLLLNGLFLHLLLQILFILPVFWTLTGRGFHGAFWIMTRFAERPDGIFQGWIRKVITVALPFSLIASYPTRYLVEGGPLWILGHVALVTAGLFALVIGLWRFALRSYSSASS